MNRPPAKLLMQIASNPSADDFVASFEHTRDDVVASLSAVGIEFERFSRILDFGCGVGRFLFAIQPKLKEHQQLFGCDVDAECASWCKQNIDFAQIAHTALDPPLPYADETFDFVYALSVFTHLSFDLQFAWSMELRRILLPRGVLFFTTHGEFHLPIAVAASYPQTDYAIIGDDGLLWTFMTSAARKDEGQREVAVFHSRSAIDEVFFGSTPLYHRRISNLAAGQSLSIRQRPAGSVAPIAAVPDRRQVTLHSRRDAAAQLVFSLPGFTGVRSFRLLLSFAQRWHEADSIRYEAAVVGADGHELKREIVEVPFKSFGGARHFVPLSVDIEGNGAPCDVVWRLSWQRPSTHTVDVTLSHARLEWRADSSPPSTAIGSGAAE